MADIDTSSYQNKVMPLNPLDTYGKAATLQGVLNQNKLFQQQFKTNKAVSDIYKRAIKEDGTLDMNMVRDEVSRNPDAAYGLEQVLKGAQDLQQGQIKTSNAQIENIQNKAKAFAGYLSPMINGGTSRDVALALAHAETNGIINDQERNKILATMPFDPTTGKFDDSKIPMWAQEQLVKVLEAQRQLDYYNPAPTPTQTPQGTRFMRVPQAMGSAPSDAGGFIPNVPGPTQQTYNPATKRNEYVGVLPNGGVGGAPQAPGGGMGAQPSAQAAPNAFAPGTPAGPALGEQEAATHTAQGSAEQGLALQRRAERVPETKAILGNLLAELNTPGFTVGPGTKSVADAAKFMNAQLGTNIRVEGNKAREQFEKLAGMYAQSQFQALGGTGANAQLDATTLTSPNSKLSEMGNRGIIAMLNGNEDAVKAKHEYWQKWSAQNGSGTYGQFVADFQKHFDPRVFQSQYLDKADQKKMISGMSQKEKNDLHSAFVFAKQNGWIQ